MTDALKKRFSKVCTSNLVDSQNKFDYVKGDVPFFLLHAGAVLTINIFRDKL